MNNVIDRFLQYVAIHTQSDPNASGCPSTARQSAFGATLAKELITLGMTDVKQDANGYVTATLPSNSTKQLPVIGFIAHLDTSPDLTGENVVPRIVENYDGKTVTLNELYSLTPERFPELLKYIGQDLIVTDGNTLLGADDKAGIAEIITAMEYLIQHPEVEHGTIRIAFTPDEEVGRGAHLFDVEAFGADWAYTIDGGEIGELEYENFNAAGAKVCIKGTNVHPGYAKNKMVNAIHLAHFFQSQLPANERPETTEKYEGFYHLMQMQGGVEECTLNLIVRDHDRTLFEARKQFLIDLTAQCNERFGEAFSIEIKDQYYNMREKVEPVMHIVDLAQEAMIQCGVAPLIKAIRGGTDGSQLSYKGLPCPNIFAGGHNFHGRYEFVPAQSMLKAVEVIVAIARLAAK